MSKHTPSEGAMLTAWHRHVTEQDSRYGLVRDDAERATKEFVRFLARVRRDAAREALDGLSADRAHVTALLRAENGGNVEDVITHYRDTHHPEEETR